MNLDELLTQSLKHIDKQEYEKKTLGMGRHRTDPLLMEEDLRLHIFTQNIRKQNPVIFHPNKMCLRYFPVKATVYGPKR